MTFITKKGTSTMSSKSPLLPPGKPAPASGQYQQVGPKGGNPGPEVTMPKGHILPPTDRPGQKYVIVDPTNNKSGRG